MQPIYLIKITFFANKSRDTTTFVTVNGLYSPPPTYLAFVHFSTGGFSSIRAFREWENVPDGISIVALLNDDGRSSRHRREFPSYTYIVNMIIPNIDR